MPTKRNQSLLYRPVPDFLRERREKGGLTQRELATKLDEGRWFVVRCESGNRRVDISEFIRWCKACDIDPCAALRELADLS